MTIYKNDLAILEFDDAYEAAIEPNHEGLDIKLPKKCVFGFLCDHIDDYALKNIDRQLIKKYSLLILAISLAILGVLIYKFGIFMVDDDLRKLK